MLTSKITSYLTAILAVLALASTARSQHYQPFIEPEYFNPDYQFFAPAEIEDFGGLPPANTGWFATYDRVYIYVTRPEDQTVEQINVPGTNQPAFISSSELADRRAGDFTWGNRFDIGYMTEEDSGWLATGWHIDGPNANDVQIVERVNRFNEDDPVGGDPEGDPVRPDRDGNNLFTFSRDYLVTNSINVADLSGFEFSKLYRREQLHYGGWIEPFFGVRYIKFIDFYQRQQYGRFDILGTPLPNLPPPPDPTTGPTEGVVEQLTSLESAFVNHMIGGQFGFRFHQQKNRWNLSSELRVFGLQNFQSFNRVINESRTIYGGSGLGDEVEAVFTRRRWAADHDAEFVFGTEVRAEAAYQLTKYLSLKVGMDFMQFAQGVGRGNDPADNEQDLTMIGGTFGVAVNR